MSERLSYYIFPFPVDYHDTIEQQAKYYIQERCSFGSGYALLVPLLFFGLYYANPARMIPRCAYYFVFYNTLFLMMGNIIKAMTAMKSFSDMERYGTIETFKDQSVLVQYTYILEFYAIYGGMWNFYITTILLYCCLMKSNPSSHNVMFGICSTVLQVISFSLIIYCSVVKGRWTKYMIILPSMLSAPMLLIMGHMLFLEFRQTLAHATQERRVSRNRNARTIQPERNLKIHSLVPNIILSLGIIGAWQCSCISGDETMMMLSRWIPIMELAVLIYMVLHYTGRIP